MLAVDTNVLVRYLTRDDEAQARRAAAAMLSDEIWISKTVLLELEWVLRGTYGFTPLAVNGVLRGLAGTENILLEDSLAVAQAIELQSLGMEFADALHVVSSRRAEKFVTFDRKLAKRSKNRTAVEVTAI